MRYHTCNGDDDSDDDDDDENNQDDDHDLIEIEHQIAKRHPHNMKTPPS